MNNEQLTIIVRKEMGRFGLSKSLAILCTLILGFNFQGLVQKLEKFEPNIKKKKTGKRDNREEGGI